MLTTRLEVRKPSRAKYWGILRPVLSHECLIIFNYPSYTCTPLYLFGTATVD